MGTLISGFTGGIAIRQLIVTSSFHHATNFAQTRRAARACRSGEYGDGYMLTPTELHVVTELCKPLLGSTASSSFALCTGVTRIVQRNTLQMLRLG